MFTIYIMLVTMLCGVHTLSARSICPTPCICSHGFTHVQCTDGGLTKVPKLPNEAIVVDLRKNKIAHIDGMPFENLNSMTKLVLEDNQLVSLNVTDFKGCTSLTDLDLLNNALSGSIHPKVFQETPQLIRLRLNENELTAVPDMQYTRNLEMLDVSKNNISSSHVPQGFYNLKNFSRFILSRNPLKSVKNDSFLALSQSIIEEILLKECDIKIVQHGSFAHFADSMRKIDFSSNPISSDTLKNIMSDFNNKTKLQSLGLASIGLHGFLPSNTFAALGSANKITSLDLSKNQLCDLQPGVFFYFPNLHDILLNKAGLSRVPDLSANKKLKTLDLRENSIISLDIINSVLPNSLQSLRLDSNRIQQLHNNKLANLAQLSHLAIANNDIAIFSSKALSGLVKLTYLDLSNNKLTYIPDVGFKETVNLQTLVLRDNKIKSLGFHAQVFSSMTDLTSIDLHGNDIHWMPTGIFQAPTKLETLDLSYNYVGYAFAENPAQYTGFLSNMKSIKRINLTTNSISILPDNLFTGDHNLENITLALNEIYRWDNKRVFEDLPKLQMLDLHSNKISVLNETSLVDLRHVTQIDLSTNSFSCICDMRWFRGFLEHTNISFIGNSTYKCDSPNDWLNKLFKSYNPTYWDCAPTWIWITISAVIAFLLFVAIAVIVYRYRWKLRFFCYTRFHRSSRNGGYNRLLGENFQYAAFISQCDEGQCNTIIEDHLLPGLFPNPEQHFADNQHVVPGVYPLICRILFDVTRSELANINHALSSSASIIILLCEHYNANRRCEFELGEALRRQRHNEGEVIVLMTDNVKTESIPTPLRSIVEEEEMVTWSKNTDAQEHCLLKLKEILDRYWHPTNSLLDTADSQTNQSTDSLETDTE